MRTRPAQRNVLDDALGEISMACVRQRRHWRQLTRETVEVALAPVLGCGARDRVLGRGDAAEHCALQRSLLRALWVAARHRFWSADARA